MVVQHNLTAMNSNRMLGITTGSQAKSTEKLSSGYKINRAADDAAGLSISEKMRKQIRGLTQASANAQDGISAVQTAEGALTEVHDMLQRMNELAVKAANGTNSEDDRSYIQDEIDQLVEEIDRVSTTTKFNETYLLKGDSDLPAETTYSYKEPAGGISAVAGTKLYKADGTEVTDADLAGIKSIDEAVAKGFFTSIKGTDGVDLTGKTGAATADFGSIVGGTGTTVEYTGSDRLYKSDGTEITEAELATYFDYTGGTLYYKNGQTDTLYKGIAGDTAAVDTDFEEAKAAKLYDKDGNEIAEADLADLFEDGKLKADAEVYDDALQTNAQLTEAQVLALLDTKTKPAALTLTLHVGADATTDNQISVDIEAMSAAGLGVDGLKVDGKDDTNALAAIETISKAIQQVSKQRSALGAVQNRLEHTINNLDNVVENTTSAESQIRDTDMATEMVRYSNNNILAQAGQAMLAQSNQANQGVLSLLG